MNSSVRDVLNHEPYCRRIVVNVPNRVNRPCMATPFPNVSGFTKRKDAYNFYHSQVIICIECTFGIICQRFSFLRQKAPKHFRMKKIIVTVSCLCKILVVLAAPPLLLAVPAAGVVTPAVLVLILFDALDVLVCSHYLSFRSCDRYSRLR